MLAAFLGIASKGIFKVNKKHFFNPANFGICATIILTHRGWISPGQWGSAGYWWFLIGMLGFIVITSAHRMETAFAFLATYALLFGYRILVYQNWPSDFFSWRRLRRQRSPHKAGTASGATPTATPAAAAAPVAKPTAKPARAAAAKSALIKGKGKTAKRR